LYHPSFIATMHHPQKNVIKHTTMPPKLKMTFTSFANHDCNTKNEKMSILTLGPLRPSFKIIIKLSNSK
jgi:hypothetical protein